MHRYLLTGLLTVVLACDLFTGTSSGVNVATDRLAYVLSPDSQVTTVEFTVENTGRATVEIPRCGPHLAVFVDLRVSGYWLERDRFGVICPSIYDMTMLALAPGERAQSTISLAPGAFRLRVPHTAPGHILDTEYATSNAFTIKDAP